MRSPITTVDIDRCETWTRYRPGLCDSCQANCCTMPLEIRLPDLVRLGLVDAFEAEHEDPARIAKRLQKARLIDRYNTKHGIFTMARRADGDCRFLEPTTRRCTVYEQRPDTCRLHPQKGPRPGYCAFGAKAAPPRPGL
ncbi:MAG: YkgJ family cysteine cluster protein [Burkholderiaceae bacterium]|nr:YkgJ family cysteine cluster protein [Burkholderiaceae bacterium]